MPLTPTGAKTFLHALSDFWSAFFKDRALLTAYAETLALDGAQLYQSLLEAALGTSLKDMPLFDRVFFLPLSLRQDQLVYREGSSPDEDTWRLPAPNKLVGAEYLANRILAPTSLLTYGRDFWVEGPSLVFRANPFENAQLSYFPRRTVQVAAPATWADPAARYWVGAQPGDLAVFTIGGASSSARITGWSGNILYLDSAPEGLRAQVDRRGARVEILSAPYDTSVVGKLLTGQSSGYGRITAGATDAVTVVGTCELDFTGEAAYRGSWASSAAYAVGDLVDQAGSLWRARAAHTSGGSFNATSWVSLQDGYVYLTITAAPQLDGVYRTEAPSAAGRVKLAIPASFAGAQRALVHRVDYTTGVSGSRPTIQLPHDTITPASFSVQATRALALRSVDAAGAVTTHAAGEAVREGVDYLLDGAQGRITYLSVWAPLTPARASYQWLRRVISHECRWRGAYATATAYALGDLVTDSGVTYAVQEAHTSNGTMDSTRYVPLYEPAAFDVARDVTELSAWATDALLDEERLYKNFGYLMDRPRASSEAYRVFLRAVSRLFLLGPTFDRFESALNAVAGLPLVRDEQERLVSYSNGEDASGADGSLLGLALGQAGTLNATTAEFQVESTPFRPTDVGAQLRIVRDGVTELLVIATYVSPTCVTVTPALTDATGVAWSYVHPVERDRIRLSGSGYRFTEADVGALVQLRGLNQHNQGAFRIASIDDALTAVLTTEYGFLDESAVSWALSRTGLQTVTTNRRSYDIPLGIPVRPDIKAAGAQGVLTFAAFEALTEAFRVVDYLEDPSWWHRITVPEALMPGDGARRTVTPQLIEHVYGALDGAAHGDTGLRYGRDDDNKPGARRAGEALWYGGEHLILNFPAGVAGVRARDVGQHLVVRTKPFVGHFKILRVENDGGTLHLDRFPPPEAEGQGAPLSLSVELPPLLYRRTIAFLLMDRRLKYHSIQVRVDPAASLSAEFLEDSLRLVRGAKPAHAFVFFETPPTLRDEMPVEETVELDLDHALNDAFGLPDAHATYATTSPLRYGDCYRFAARTADITPTAGSTQTLPTTLPSGATAVRTLVSVGFAEDARVGGRRPVEGIDYRVNYPTGELTILEGVTLTPDPVTVSYVDCLRRVLAPSDTHDDGETAIVYGGADPTFVRQPGSTPDASGLVDRAVQLTLGS